jgi:hypothetical protein
MEGTEDDEDTDMVMDIDNITEEIPGHSLIPPVQHPASDPPQRVGSANTDAPCGVGEAEKKAANGSTLNLSSITRLYSSYLF